MQRRVIKTNCKYVVVKESEYSFARLRRADSNEIQSLVILWEGNNLRKGYDAMIEINKEDKVSKLRIYAMVKSTGELRISTCYFPAQMGKPWQEISSFHLSDEKKVINSIKKSWTDKLNSLKQLAEIELTKKVTLADMRYLCWKYHNDPNLLFLAD